MKNYTIKNKKAFTLIELLAIIVILSIISVITVPIVLDIIEKAKIGAARASAYGYRDSINKFYVSSLSDEEETTMDDGLYSAAQIKNIGITPNGQEPESGSWVLIENSEVTLGCVQFDDYKVELRDGDIYNAEIGTCDEYPVPSCPGCVFKYDFWDRYFKGTEGKDIEDTKVIGGTYDYTKVNKHNVFLGFILDENNQIERAFACGMKGDTPYCIEGTTDGSKDSANRTLLNSEELWNGNCEEEWGGNYYNCPSETTYPRTSTNGTVKTFYSEETGNEAEELWYHCTTSSPERNSISCDMDHVL